MQIQLRACAIAAMATFAVLTAGCNRSDHHPTSPTDTQAPTVRSTNPVGGTTGVAVITASFSEPMRASSLTGGAFDLTAPGGVQVAGAATYNTSTETAQFTPNAALTPNTLYTATIMRSAVDLSGNALAADFVWTFTTAATTGHQLTLALGAASPFVVLAGSTVTSTGPTTLGGDLGVSPGTAVTGFPPGTLIGAKHPGDASSALALTDLTTAYNNAAGLTLAPVTVAGNLGGLTLPPGLYKSTSSLAISSGDLTLDAGGDANAVFIFQIASTLSTTSGRKVILSGGAKAGNVFWQVGSSATLGTTTSFKGTIMADQSITLNTGAMLNGRALARIGAVTLASNAIVLPTP